MSNLLKHVPLELHVPLESTAEFFEAAYRQAADPWNFAGSAYEQGRYQATLAALNGQRFRRAYEPGCSIGVLTERLAELCDVVDGVDLSETAVQHARIRCGHLPQVTLTCGGLPPWPDLSLYDLVVLSEIGYYFSAHDLQVLADELVRGMLPGTTLLAVHWTGSSRDHQISGDEVHDKLHAQAALESVRGERHEGFRLDKWVKR